MRAINHALTGALIGLSVSSPFMALPAALLSHFACDALPHYGNGEKVVKTRLFKISLVIDALLCLSVVLALYTRQPNHWLVAAFCAFLATTPDMWSIRFFIRYNKGEAYKPGRIRRFSQAIQWFERPIGALVEVAWFAGSVLLFSQFL